MTTQTIQCSYCESDDHRLEECVAHRTVQCVAEWVQIALQENYQQAHDGGMHGQGAWANIPVEMAHSALLKRLISGKRPLELAPPRSYAYPWYTLYETGEGNACEVSVPTQALGTHQRPIVIDQGVWDLLEARDDGTWLVQWAPGHPRFLVQPHPAPPHAFARYLVSRVD